MQRRERMPEPAHNVLLLPRYGFGRLLLRPGGDRGALGLITYPVAVALAYLLAPLEIAAAATCRAPSPLMSTATTLAPAAAKASAEALPMPWPAPVTTAI